MVDEVRASYALAQQFSAAVLDSIPKWGALIVESRTDVERQTVWSISIVAENGDEFGLRWQRGFWRTMIMVLEMHIRAAYQEYDDEYEQNARDWTNRLAGNEELRHGAETMGQRHAGPQRNRIERES